MKNKSDEREQLIQLLSKIGVPRVENTSNPVASSGELQLSNEGKAQARYGNV